MQHVATNSSVAEIKSTWEPEHNNVIFLIERVYWLNSSMSMQIDWAPT